MAHQAGEQEQTGQIRTFSSYLDTIKKDKTSSSNTCCLTQFIAQIVQDENQVRSSANICTHLSCL